MFSEDDGLIVGVNYAGQQRLALDEEFIAGGGARPDMLLSDKENGLTLIFEVKLGDLLYREQIKRHFNMFFDPSRARLDRVFVEVSWSEIAEYLGAVQQQTRDPVEGLFIVHFIEYLDSLNLTDFMPFRASDFSEQNKAKLHKLIAATVFDLRPTLGLREYEFNQRVYFEDRAMPDNLWIDYVRDNLLIAIIVGSGNQRRARALKNYIANDSAQLRRLLEELHGPLDSFGTLIVKGHARFRLDRFRTEELDVGEENNFPNDYESQPSPARILTPIAT